MQRAGNPRISSVEFADFRNYVVGDDLRFAFRRIDFQALSFFDMSDLDGALCSFVEKLDQFEVNFIDSDTPIINCFFAAFLFAHSIWFGAAPPASARGTASLSCPFQFTRQLRYPIHQLRQTRLFEVVFDFEHQPGADRRAIGVTPYITHMFRLEYAETDGDGQVRMSPYALDKPALSVTLSLTSYIVPASEGLTGGSTPTAPAPATTTTTSSPTP